MEAETIEAELVESEADEKDKDQRLAKFDPVKAGLAELTEKYSDGPPADLSVPENYEACRLAVSEMRKKRTGAEKIRKELKADALEYGRKVDGIAKQIIDHIANLEEPYAKAKKDYDTKVEIEKREKALAEERRVDGIASRIAEIGALVTAHVSSSSSVIDGLYPELHGALDTVEHWAMEFADKATSTINDTLAKLDELHSMKVQQEQFAAEKARAEKEAAEKAEADRIQREKEAAAERERLEKEREKLAAEQAELEQKRAEHQAELDRQRKEQQEAFEKERAALQAEKDRIADEQAERERKARAEQEEKERLENEVEQQRIAADQAKQAKESAAVQRAAPSPEDHDVPDKTVMIPKDQAIENYREAGKAIKAITNDFQMAKTILDSIINGTIPHITYTGA